MGQSLIIEAVMIAIYGQLLMPKSSLEYKIPYRSVMELYELQEERIRIMPEKEDDAVVKKNVQEMIAYFSYSFNRKKLERSLLSPWKQSPPFPLNDRVSFVVVNGSENMQFGEKFDALETEMLLMATRFCCPILTDQLEFQEKVQIERLDLQLYDIDHFAKAVENTYSQVTP